MALFFTIFTCILFLFPYKKRSSSINGITPIKFSFFGLVSIIAGVALSVLAGESFYEVITLNSTMSWGRAYVAGLGMTLGGIISFIVEKLKQK